jgi:hypothetical protein
MNKTIVSLGEVRQMHAPDRVELFDRGVLDYRPHSQYAPGGTGPGRGPEWVLGTLVCRNCELRWDAIHPDGVRGAECPRCAALAGYDTSEHERRVQWLSEQGLRAS